MALFNNCILINSHYPYSKAPSVPGLGMIFYAPFNNSSPKTHVMLKWAAIFFVIAIIAAIFGFTGIAAGAASIAKILFFIFLVLFILVLIFGAKLLEK